MKKTLAAKLDTKMVFSEKELNGWLSDNPNRQVVDIKLAGYGIFPTILVIYLKEVSK